MKWIAIDHVSGSTGATLLTLTLKLPLATLCMNTYGIPLRPVSLSYCTETTTTELAVTNELLTVNVDSVAQAAVVRLTVFTIQAVASISTGLAIVPLWDTTATTGAHVGTHQDSLPFSMNTIASSTVHAFLRHNFVLLILIIVRVKGNFI